MRTHKGHVAQFKCKTNCGRVVIDWLAKIINVATNDVYFYYFAKLSDLADTQH